MTALLIDLAVTIVDHEIVPGHPSIVTTAAATRTTTRIVTKIEVIGDVIGMIAVIAMQIVIIAIPMDTIKIVEDPADMIDTGTGARTDDVAGLTTMRRLDIMTAVATEAEEMILIDIHIEIIMPTMMNTVDGTEAPG